MNYDVSPENSTVLGYDNSEDYWPYLRFDHAVARQRSTAVLFLVGQSGGTIDDVPIDVHLSVPFAKDENENCPVDDLPWYRVRPKSDDVVKAERVDGKWKWATVSTSGGD